MSQTEGVSSSPHSRTSSFLFVAIGAQIAISVASVTGAQIAMDTTNLQVLLAACATILGAAVLGTAQLLSPRNVETLLSKRNGLQIFSTALLVMGGIVGVVASNVYLWGVGLFAVGLGVGLTLVRQPFRLQFVVGLLIGPSFGVLLATISWRAPAALAIINAGLIFRLDRGEATSAPPLTTRYRSRRLIGFSAPIVFFASAVSFPAALFFFRNETLLGRIPLPIAIAIAGGALLGVWRGQVFQTRGIARRSIRQGAWLILLFGTVGTFLTRDILPDVLNVALSFFVGFGGARILASAALLYAPAEGETRRKTMSVVLAGSALAVVPLATAGNESLFWQMREVKQSYPNSASFATLNHGVLSMPAAFDASQDPRLGSLSGSMRSAAQFMTQQHLALTLQFASGIAALLCLLLSFGLPRQRSHKTFTKMRNKAIHHDRATRTVGLDLKDA
jgi:hypothetical protein